MTTFLLVRHAAHVRQDRLVVGRMPGVGLGGPGLAQVDRLADRLGAKPADAVWSGPLERAVATAGPVAARLGLEVRVTPALDELDYGDWTGRSPDELAAEPAWGPWNAFRSGTRVPGGETMLEVQARVVGLAGRLREAHPDGRVVLVSHAEVLRALLLHHLGVPLDLFWRVALDPGSVSVLEVTGDGARVLRLNETGEPP